MKLRFERLLRGSRGKGWKIEGLFATCTKLIINLGSNAEYVHNPLEQSAETVFLHERFSVRLAQTPRCVKGAEFILQR